MLKHACLALAIALAAAHAAEAAPALPFNSNSLADIQKANDGKPFILLLWSLDCASCIKEMDGLAKTVAKHPDLKLVMVATDDIVNSAQVEAVLRKHHLEGIESWTFAEPNAQKLRYGIDPSWFGELPRSYFYDARHQRKAQSGVLKPEQIESWLAAQKS
jgi:thiol-disulfide isomerase/thioredoxin